MSSPYGTSENWTVGGGRPQRGLRLKKGTRMLRIRTKGRVSWQGQPERPRTHPGIPHAELPRHVCAECFGPRSHYRRGPFCARCETALFGNSRDGYQAFLRSERARNREAVRKRARAS